MIWSESMWNNFFKSYFENREGRLSRLMSKLVKMISSLRYNDHTFSDFHKMSSQSDTMGSNFKFFFRICPLTPTLLEWIWGSHIVWDHLREKLRKLSLIFISQNLLMKDGLYVVPSPKRLSLLHFKFKIPIEDELKKPEP